MTTAAADNELCESSDLRLLANVAYLAAKMRWSDESDQLYEAIAEVTQTPAEVLFAWISARCETGDHDGARELLERLLALPQTTPEAAEMAEMAQCCVACASDAADWVNRARAIVARGPACFGYETAQAMLDAQQAPAR